MMKAEEKSTINNLLLVAFDKNPPLNIQYSTIFYNNLCFHFTIGWVNCKRKSRVRIDEFLWAGLDSFNKKEAP